MNNDQPLGSFVWLKSFTVAHHHDLSKRLQNGPNSAQKPPVACFPAKTTISLTSGGESQAAQGVMAAVSATCEPKASGRAQIQHLEPSLTLEPGSQHPFLSTMADPGAA